MQRGYKYRRVSVFKKFVCSIKLYHITFGCIWLLALKTRGHLIAAVTLNFIFSQTADVRHSERGAPDVRNLKGIV